MSRSSGHVVDRKVARRALGALAVVAAAFAVAMGALAAARLRVTAAALAEAMGVLAAARLRGREQGTTSVVV